MWDLAGLELTGRYGTWFERSYELVDMADGVALLMSAEQAPGPDWERRTPDAFYGEKTRWMLVVPRSEITDPHETIVQGKVDGVFVRLLAQRLDGTWAVASDGEEIPVLCRLGLTVEGGVWTGWVPRRLVSDITRVTHDSWPEAC